MAGTLYFVSLFCCFHPLGTQQVLVEVTPPSSFVPWALAGLSWGVTTPLEWFVLEAEQMML